MATVTDAPAASGPSSRLNAAPGGGSALPPGFRVAQVIQEFSREGGVETVAYELQRQWEAHGIPSELLVGSVAADIEPGATRIRYALPRALASRVPTRGRWRYAGRAMIVPAFTLAASAILRAGQRPGGWAEGAVVLSHGDSLVADVVVLHAVNAASLAQKRRDGQWRWALNPMHAWVGARDRVMLGGRRARRYVAVSKRVVAELAEHHGVPAERVTVIPNGTDLDRFTPAGPPAGLRAQFAIPEPAPVLLFVGHEFDRKGLAHAIQALREPGCDAAHLVAVGAGDAEQFARLAAEAGVGSRVHFTGARRDLPALYRDADAFVFPSAYETFALVCMEALACGVPVFAARAGGIEDYLEDGVNGFGVARDGGSVGAALAPVLHDRELLARLRTGARSTALRFGWPQVAQRYRDMLVEVWHEKHAYAGK